MSFQNVIVLFVTTGFANQSFFCHYVFVTLVALNDSRFFTVFRTSN